MYAFQKAFAEGFEQACEVGSCSEKNIQLKNRIQRLRGNNQFLQRREVISEVFQELVLGSVLVNTFRNNLEKVARR